MSGQIRQFWDRNEHKIVLLLGFILVSAISFEAGLLKGRGYNQKPVVIEKTASPAAEVLGATGDSFVGSNSAQGPSNMTNPINVASSSNTPQNCTFVGSKNSNKYHLPTCRWAKNIKPENLVCFSSAEDAVKKGYQPDGNCVK